MPISSKPVDEDVDTTVQEPVAPVVPEVTEPTEPVVPAPGEVVAPTEPVEEDTEDLGSVENANKANNEALVGDGPSGGTFVENPKRKKSETQAEYNERVPVAVQPVLPGPTHSYLGDKL